MDCSLSLQGPRRPFSFGVAFHGAAGRLLRGSSSVTDIYLLSVAARRLTLTLRRTLKRSKEQTDDTHSSWQGERISEACFVRVYRRSRFLFSSEVNKQRLLIRSESSCRDPFSLPFRFASHLASFLGTLAVGFALHVSLKDLAV